jgi:hypothetical protein
MLTAKLTAKAVSPALTPRTRGNAPFISDTSLADISILCGLGLLFTMILLMLSLPIVLDIF